MLNDSQHIGHSRPSSALAFEEVSSSEKSELARLGSTIFFFRLEVAIAFEKELHMVYSRSSITNGAVILLLYSQKNKTPGDELRPRKMSNSGLNMNGSLHLDSSPEWKA